MNLSRAVGVVVLAAGGLACRERGAAGARVDGGPPPAATIDHSAVFVLPRSANGRSYQLMVQTPGSYAEHPVQRYPVIYVTDALSQRRMHRHDWW